MNKNDGKTVHKEVPSHLARLIKGQTGQIGLPGPSSTMSYHSTSYARSSFKTTIENHIQMHPRYSPQ